MQIAPSGRADQTVRIRFAAVQHRDLVHLEMGTVHFDPDAEMLDVLGQGRSARDGESGDPVTLASEPPPVQQPGLQYLEQFGVSQSHRK